MNRLIKIGLREYGNREIPGKRHNEQIVRYAQEAGFNYINDDETPWCSIFLNWVAMMGGYEGSGSPKARTWLEVGSNIIDPLMGDIVVFWRESPQSWKGHVGLFVSRVGDDIWCLGGNQSNSVNISSYPASQLLGFRRLYKKC